jgi:outer membrane lipoprotein-sorting protein
METHVLTRVLTAALLLLATASFSPDPKGMAVLQRLLKTWDSVQTLTFRMHKTERMCDGETLFEKANVKLRKPGDVYLGNIEPKPGQEAIYSPARNKKELVAHRGSFPDVTVEISIYGGLATDGQHHVITHTGFAYLLGQIRAGVEESRRNFHNERLEYGGSLYFHGRAAEKIILHAGDKEDRRVVAKRDESLFAFARKVDADPYLIAYHNDGLDELTDRVSEGVTYVVPAYYGAKTEIILDKELGLPLRTSIWDSEGRIYEQFEYFDMKVNPPLTDLDFDPENPAYGF